MIEITRLAKTGGPLTKRISLAEDGKLVSDGSACIMSNGRAWRTTCTTLQDLATGISSLRSDEAIALGALRHDLPDEVEVVTKHRLNGDTADHLIARTADHIVYRRHCVAVALIDIDTKGMPATVRAHIKALGGFWPALASVLPALATAGRVVRKSTSTGLSRTDTGERLPGSEGHHIYILVRDGSDIERFLRTMHDRCWLAGLGWLMVGAGGQLLDRSVVDRMVCAPERLVFEGAPVLDPPLAQDQELRQATAHDGEPLDSLAACLPLRIVEQAKLRDLKAAEAHRLAPDRAKVRQQFIGEQASRIVERTGCTPEAARQTVERQCSGVLLPAVVLPFDAEEMRGCTVADVLADPDRFVGATLADPLEGVDYGRCCAKVMQRPDGTLWIHSFAHGRTVYELKHDVDAIAAIVAQAADAEAVDLLARLAAAGDIADHALEQLVDALAQRCKVGKRTIARAIAHQRKDQAHRQHQEDQVRRTAERSDPRPRIVAPAPDAPWLPQMAALNEVLGASSAVEPPMRDVDGAFVAVRVRRVPNMHALTASGVNEAEDSRLPAPEHLC